MRHVAIDLRGYQREAIDSLYLWFETQGGDPVLVCPTGSGKSVIQAAFLREVLKKWPDQRILCLVHVKELIEQNYARLKELWPVAPAGIYSAGVGRKESHHPITFAGIQSVYKKAHELGHRDLILVDEAHLCPPAGEGMYRTLLTGLRATNPHLRLIGLTGTPFRMGQGYLWDGEDALFDGPAYEIGIRQLIAEGFLSPLTTAPVQARAELKGIRKRQGEFVAEELEKAMESITEIAVQEILEFGSDRKKWLLFCSGVEHAFHVRDLLKSNGVCAETITGETPMDEREKIIAAFRSGEIRALTNMSVLTTGFDVPDIDLLVFLRPTLSPGLYIQMAGRAMRIAPGKEDALVLDFARNIQRHGPIDQVGAPRTKSGETGEAPQKKCPACKCVCHAAAQECPDCGYAFPAKGLEDKLDLSPSTANAITSDKPERREVHGVIVSLHEKTGKPPSIRVNYNCGLQEVSQWICPLHGEYARYKAEKWWARMIDAPMPEDIHDAVHVAATKIRTPVAIWTRMNGKFEEIIRIEV